MHMKVSDALADDVVDRDERSITVESGRHARRHSLHTFEERANEIRIEVTKSHDVTSRCDQHMSLENRRAVEKRDHDVVAHHFTHGQRSIDRITERTGWFGHGCILAPRQDDTMHTTRIEPVINPSDEVNELYDKAGLRAPDGSPLNIFGTLAHHPALLRRWLVFATHVLAKNSLAPRDRELLILRTGWRCSSQYEFSQHALLALRCDMTDDEVQRTKLAVDDGGWDDHDAALLNAADELHDNAHVSDTTWGTLASRLSDQQMLDVIFTVGNYHTVSFALNSCGVQLDDGVPAAM